MNTSNSQERYFLMLWDCPKCGTQGIPGNRRRCPNPYCLHWKSKDVVDYLPPEDQRIYVTPGSEEEREAIAGADWICQYCHARNSPLTLDGEVRTQCENCGFYHYDSTDGEDSDPERIAVETLEVPTSCHNSTLPGVSPRETNSDRSTQTQPNPSPTQSKPLPKVAIPAIAVSLIGLVFTGGYFLSRPHIYEGRISQLSWEVTREIQQQEIVRQSGWNPPPSDAFNIRSDRRQRGTQTVTVGYTTETVYETQRVRDGSETQQVQKTRRVQSGTRQECRTRSTGSGYAKETCRSVPVYTTETYTETVTVPRYKTVRVPVEKQVPITREEPVYDTWYEYSQREWRSHQTLRNRGLENEAIAPPRFQLSQNPPQRALDPKTTCSMNVILKEQRATQLDIPCSTWQRLDTGDSVTLQKTAIGGYKLLPPRTTQP